MHITCVTHPLLYYINVHNIHLALFAFLPKKTSPAVKNEPIYTFLMTETIILVDGYKFTDKDGLDFTFIWVHDLEDRGDRLRVNTRRVREDRVLRIQNGSLTSQHDTEKHRESFLKWPIFDRNFNLQMGKSFNFI